VIKQRFDRIAAHHLVGNRVSMAFVHVAGLAEAVFEMDTGALLHHVRRLMCGRLL
jgi:hypothetical protein